jgi:hypothetical protein
MENMEIDKAFEEIMLYSHFRNWTPDWQVAKEIYQSFPNSYSVLTPFAYSYLEEMIRSTTSEYGKDILYSNGRTKKKRRAGMDLLKLAISENQRNQTYIGNLEEIKKYYYNSSNTDEGDNRHSVAHGYMHPRFWSKEAFEGLIFDIARLSKFSNF